jgi:hypothetical protein
MSAATPTAGRRYPPEDEEGEEVAVVFWLVG